jgi:hypothetical protein
LLRYRFLFNAVVVIASYGAAFVGTVLQSVAIVGTLVAFSLILAYHEHRYENVQPESKELQAVLEREILPDLIDDYREVYPDPNPPAIRVNVMILRRRNLNPLQRSRSDVYPGEKTLKAEATVGDYESRNERELEWKTNEGVVGRAMNERAQEIWADLGHGNERVQAGWNLTNAQISRTKRLNSLLSIPIYLPGDEEKVKPVGVLNIDSEQNLDVTKFGTEAVRAKAINQANIIGAILE